MSDYWSRGSMRIMYGGPPSALSPREPETPPFNAETAIEEIRVVLADLRCTLAALEGRVALIERRPSIVERRYRVVLTKQEDPTKWYVHENGQLSRVPRSFASCKRAEVLAAYAAAISEGGSVRIVRVRVKS